MIGKIIGNYQITGELAQGGMGAVYRAQHRRLPREAVIKSILLSSFSPSAQTQLKARFRREACIQSQLDHQNIVRVYEFFETEDNYYLVMEYVPGVSLRDLLDTKGVPTPAQAVYLFKQVLSALDYAHNFTYVDESNNRHTGIIHRDINPANLLVDSKGQVKITDFGTVKLVGDSGLTQAGFHPGTIEYMSPEQLRGLEIDARSDIYSLGVTFYEVLTGQLPFPRPLSGSDWEVRKGHIELNPPSILKLRPGVPSELATIVMRALQKNPADRYRSAAEFLAALTSYKRSFAIGSQKSPARSGKLAFSTVPQTLIEPEMSESPADDYPFEGTITAPLPPGETADEMAGGGWPFRITPSAPTKVSNPLNATMTGKVLASVTRPALSRYRWALTAALSGLLLAGGLLAVHYFSGQSDKNGMQAVMTKVEDVSRATDNPSPQPTTSVIALNRAEELEKQERYDEAIVAYESYLWRNPDAGDADKVGARIAEIRRFLRAMEAAKAAASGNRLMTARQHYTDALLIIPDSQLARTGLAEVEYKIAALRR